MNCDSSRASPFGVITEVDRARRFETGSVARLLPLHRQHGLECGYARLKLRAATVVPRNAPPLPWLSQRHGRHGRRLRASPDDSG